MSERERENEIKREKIEQRGRWLKKDEGGENRGIKRREGEREWKDKEKGER